MQDRGVDARDSCDDDELSDFLSLDGVHGPCDGGCCAAAVMDCIVISQFTIQFPQLSFYFQGRSRINIFTSMGVSHRDSDLQHCV